jgi:hypothetical protein
MRSHDFSKAFRNFVCIEGEILHGGKQDFGLPGNRSTLTVREFLAAAVGLAGMSSSFVGRQTDSLTGANRESSDPISGTARLQLGAGTIEISFGPGGFDLPCESIIAWIKKAARAVAQYYGIFPVPFTRVRVNSSERQSGAFGGETWASEPPFTRVFVGRHTTSQQLDEDWLMTHEFVHTAFPNVADEHHWIEEGIATYVEPIARAQIGDLTPERIWTDMLRGMPNGEPQRFDKGLDHTHTWGRTYWGGALFCLLADVRIRQGTNNRRGLQDALRGIRDAGGTIDKHWAVERAFEIGDKASQTSVLTMLYSEMKDKPVYVDLPMLWRELGVDSSNGVISLRDSGPLARIRKSITSPNFS